MMNGRLQLRKKENFLLKRLMKMEIAIKLFMKMVIRGYIVMITKMGW